MPICLFVLSGKLTLLTIVIYTHTHTHTQIFICKYSGAQISAICNEAALHAARENRDSVTSEDLDFATARVVSGR